MKLRLTHVPAQYVSNENIVFCVLWKVPIQYQDLGSNIGAKTKKIYVKN
jgi:hypothetical protein